jgi:hypothetical protein
MTSEPSPQSLTPRTDAFALSGDGHLFNQDDYDFAASLETELTQLRAERDSLKVENEQLRAQSRCLMEERINKTRP